jgi:hypothetical protein
MHTHRVHSVTARVRDAFRVEPLEPRVLLSADPVFTPLSVVILPEERDLQDKLRLAEQQSHGEASMASSDAMLGMLASVPNVPVGLQVTSATQALLATGSCRAPPFPLPLPLPLPFLVLSTLRAALPAGGHGRGLAGRAVMPWTQAAGAPPPRPLCPPPLPPARPLAQVTTWHGLGSIFRRLGVGNSAADSARVVAKACAR